MTHDGICCEALILLLFVCAHIGRKKNKKLEPTTTKYNWVADNVE
jgi:hypothetical protein